MQFLLSIAFIISLSVLPFSAAAHGDESHIEVLPPSAAYETGDEVQVTIMLHTVEAATSVRTYVSYDTDSLRVAEINTNEETFPFWWKQAEENGVIELEASVPSPGFQGEAEVATIVFEATAAGNSEFAAGQDSLVLNAQDENLLAAQAESSEDSGQAVSSDPARAGADQPNTTLVLLGVAAAIVIGGGAVFLVQRKSKK